MKIIALYAAVALLACAAPSVLAGPLGIAGDYSMFIFNDVNTSSDTQGRVAVGGNATFGSYSIADQLSTGNYNSLVVGKDLTYNGGQIYHGNVFVGGNAKLTNGLTVTQGSLTVGGNLTSGGASSPPGGVFVHGTTSIPGYWSSSHLASAPTSPIDFAAESTFLHSLSTSWSGRSITGGTTLTSSTLNLTGSDPTLNIFFIPGSQLGPASTLNINVPANSTVLINVDGTSVNFDNMGVTNTTGAANTIYNFYQATSLNISSIDTLGSVFAPYADVSAPSGVIRGQLIANSLTGGIQIDTPTFVGSIPPPTAALVPEPASLGLLAAGAAALLLRPRRSV